MIKFLAKWQKCYFVDSVLTSIVKFLIICARNGIHIAVLLLTCTEKKKCCVQEFGTWHSSNLL